MGIKITGYSNYYQKTSQGEQKVSTKGTQGADSTSEISMTQDELESIKKQKEFLDSDINDTEAEAQVAEAEITAALDQMTTEVASAQAELDTVTAAANTADSTATAAEGTAQALAKYANGLPKEEKQYDEKGNFTGTKPNPEYIAAQAAAAAAQAQAEELRAQAKELREQQEAAAKTCAEIANELAQLEEDKEGLTEEQQTELDELKQQAAELEVQLGEISEKVENEKQEQQQKLENEKQEQQQEPDGQVTYDEEKGTYVVDDGSGNVATYEFAKDENGQIASTEEEKATLTGTKIEDKNSNKTTDVVTVNGILNIEQKDEQGNTTYHIGADEQGEALTVVTNLKTGVTASIDSKGEVTYKDEKGNELDAKAVREKKKAAEAKEEQTAEAKQDDKTAQDQNPVASPETQKTGEEQSAQAADENATVPEAEETKEAAAVEQAEETTEAETADKTTEAETADKTEEAQEEVITLDNGVKVTIKRDEEGNITEKSIRDEIGNPIKVYEEDGCKVAEEKDSFENIVMKIKYTKPQEEIVKYNKEDGTNTSVIHNDGVLHSITNDENVTTDVFKDAATGNTIVNIHEEGSSDIAATAFASEEGMKIDFGNNQYFYFDSDGNITRAEDKNNDITISYNEVEAATSTDDAIIQNLEITQNKEKAKELYAIAKHALDNHKTTIEELEKIEELVKRTEDEINKPSGNGEQAAPNNETAAEAVDETEQVTTDETEQVTTDETEQVTTDETEQVTTDETEQVAAEEETEQVTTDETEQVAAEEETEEAAAEQDYLEEIKDLIGKNPVKDFCTTINNNGTYNLVGVTNLLPSEKNPTIDIKNLKEGDYSFEDNDGNSYNLNITINNDNKTYTLNYDDNTVNNMHHERIFNTENNTYNHNTYINDDLVEIKEVVFGENGNVDWKETYDIKTLEDNKTEFKTKTKDGEYKGVFDSSNDTLKYYDNEGKEYDTPEDAIAANNKKEEAKTQDDNSTKQTDANKTDEEAKASPDKETKDNEKIENYDRQDGNRAAIVNHDNIENVTGNYGMDESNVHGVQYDTDVYRDRHRDEYGDNKDNIDEYYNTVAEEVKADLAQYYGIEDTNTEEGKKALAYIYDTILESNKDLYVYRDKNDDDFINSMSYAIAVRSWDGPFDNDYIDMNGVKKEEIQRILEDKQTTTEAEGTETPAAETATEGQNASEGETEEGEQGTEETPAETTETAEEPAETTEKTPAETTEETPAETTEETPAENTGTETPAENTGTETPAENTGTETPAEAEAEETEVAQEELSEPQALTGNPDEIYGATKADDGSFTVAGIDGLTPVEGEQINDVADLEDGNEHKFTKTDENGNTVELTVKVTKNYNNDKTYEVTQEINDEKLISSYSEKSNTLTSATKNSKGDTTAIDETVYNDDGTVKSCLNRTYETDEYGDTVTKLDSWDGSEWISYVKVNGTNDKGDRFQYFQDKEGKYVFDNAEQAKAATKALKALKAAGIDKLTPSQKLMLNGNDLDSVIEKIKNGEDVDVDKFIEENQELINNTKNLNKDSSSLESLSDEEKTNAVKMMEYYDMIMSSDAFKNAYDVDGNKISELQDVIDILDNFKAYFNYLYGNSYNYNTDPAKLLGQLERICDNLSIERTSDDTNEYETGIEYTSKYKNKNGTNVSETANSKTGNIKKSSIKIEGDTEIYREYENGKIQKRVDTKKDEKDNVTEKTIYDNYHLTNPEEDTKQSTRKTTIKYDGNGNPTSITSNGKTYEVKDGRIFIDDAPVADDFYLYKYLK